MLHMLVMRARQGVLVQGSPGWEQYESCSSGGRPANVSSRNRRKCSAFPVEQIVCSSEVDGSVGLAGRSRVLSMVTLAGINKMTVA